MRRFRFQLFCASICLALTVSGFAQAAGGVAGAATSMSNIPMKGTAGIEPLMLSVVDEKLADLDRPASVKVYNENTKQVEWQTVKSSEIRFEDLGPGKYEVEVSAVGYLTARKEIQMLGESHPVHVQVVSHHPADRFAVRLARICLPS